MKEKRIIPKEFDPRKLQSIFNPAKVGIYARVSTSKKAQLHSMSAQASELTRLVARRTDWKLTDIYLDFESASGAKMRDGFYRMLEDAKNKRIDVLITKSVQRFGRNTEENITALRTLVSSGVVVYFVLEGIVSDQPNAEFMASLYSALAEQDNASHREERLWGIKRKAENGTSEMYRRVCYGYYKNKDGVLVIDREKAEVVKSIYSAYLNGASISGIKKMLENKQIPSPTGGEKWAARTIDLILSNEKYYGTIVLFKTVTIKHPYSVRVSNREGNFCDRYVVTNGVDAIIDEETYQRVQEEKKRRSSYEEGPEGKQRRKVKYSSKKADN